MNDLDSIALALKDVNATLEKDVKLLAVSKTHPVDYISVAYEAGQRDFAENKVQELQTKVDLLPKDICWHFIGHLQTNKVKYIAPYIYLIHTVDSLRLMQVISKEAVKNQREIDILLELHVAKEATKTGLSPEELFQLLDDYSSEPLPNVRIRGLMTMATNTDDEVQIGEEFAMVKSLFDEVKAKYFSSRDSCFDQLSMGMSNDYTIAMKHGSTIVRVGSKIFGNRYY
ncbi:MAG: YggS family pyridoxal phosphate-dependent enzyme [Marinilabiliaceae bacterium]|nr:YggS family pyridoxal phosphate-dependent enzyme [Marinilabiliaceae bacterium]